MPAAPGMVNMRAVRDLDPDGFSFLSERARSDRECNDQFDRPMFVRNGAAISTSGLWYTVIGRKGAF